MDDGLFPYGRPMLFDNGVNKWPSTFQGRGVPAEDESARSARPPSGFVGTEYIAMEDGRFVPFREHRGDGIVDFVYDATQYVCTNKGFLTRYFPDVLTLDLYVFDSAGEICGMKLFNSVGDRGERIHRISQVIQKISDQPKAHIKDDGESWTCSDEWKSVGKWHAELRTNTRNCLSGCKWELDKWLKTLDSRMGDD